MYEQTNDRKDQNRGVASPHCICEDTAEEGGDINEEAVELMSDKSHECHGLLIELTVP